MADRAVARRYSQAFIGLAGDTNADKFGEELAGFLNLAKANDATLFKALSNPVFTLTERRATLDAVLKKLKLDKLTSNLLKLLLEKGRFSVLPEVNESYQELADIQAGRARVRVTTASPLTGPLESELRASLEKATGKTVVLESDVDPDLIAGMIARVGSTVYDSSIRSRLRDIKTNLLVSQF
jgi:F-type H+-transporting ATPase subunit delta